MQYGQQYGYPDYGRGAYHPVKPADQRGKRCTDVLCALVFVLFLGLLGYGFHEAQQKGNVHRVTHAMDFQGRLCGYDADVVVDKYLYYCLDKTSPTPKMMGTDWGVCVLACPEDANGQIPGCPDPEDSAEEAIDNAEAGEPDTDPQANLPTQLFAGKYCLPTDPELAGQVIYGGKALAAHSTEVAGMFESVYRVDVELVVALFVGLLTALVYLFLMKYFAKPVLWGFLAVAILLHVGLGVVMLGYEDQVLSAVAEAPPAEGASRIPADDLRAFVDETSGLESSKTLIGGGCIFLALVYAVMACWHRNKINAAMDLIEEAIDILFKVPSLFLQPLLNTLMLTAIASTCLYGLVLVYTSGENVPEELPVTPGEEGGSVVLSEDHTTFQRAEGWEWRLAVGIFGTMWIIETFWALCQYVTAAVICVWFYAETDDDDNKALPNFLPLRAAGEGLFYHLGSLALAGLAFLVFRVPAWLCSFVAVNDPEDMNCVQELLRKPCCCCQLLWDRLLQFIRSELFVNVALLSEDTITASISATKVLCSYQTISTALSGATLLFQVTGVAVSVAAGGGGTYYWITREDSGYTLPESEEYVENPLVAAAAAGACAMLAAVSVMHSLGHTADTLLYCVLQESARSPTRTGQRDYAPHKILNLIQNIQPVGY